MFMHSAYITGKICVENLFGCLSFRTKFKDYYFSGTLNKPLAINRHGKLVNTYK